MPSLWDRVLGRESQPESRAQTLSEMLRDNDLVYVHNPELGSSESPYVVTAPKQLSNSGSAYANTPSMAELGAATVSPFTSMLRAEYNAELMGVQGYRKYDQMRKNDGTVRGTLRLIKTPVLGARWFVEAASESTRDQNAADFVWWNLTQALHMPFNQLLQESLLMLDFGYYMFEKVWGKTTWNNREVMYWKKLAPRHPVDVIEWLFDGNGGPNAARFMNPTIYNADSIDIKIEKLLVFTFDKEAGNIQGIPVLRSAYKHWYYKEQLYKIDAIQKERHGIGIPVIQLPPNFTPEDRNLATDMGKNLRTNESAHVVLPPNWTLTFAELGGQPVDALKSAEHHDLQIQKNIVAPFLDKGATPENMDTFLQASRFIADIVVDTFNKYAIPQLIQYNFQRVGVPKLRATAIGSRVDQRVLSFAVRNLVGAGVLRPDERLESWMREEMDLPKAEPSTMRIIAAPQLAQALPSTAREFPPGAQKPSETSNAPTVAKVGLPRQSTAAGMIQTQTPGHNGRVGQDASGG